jgi:DNA-binding transcriptional ArsR family regulator
MTDMAAIARLLGEPARMAMLEALLDGGTKSGRELAKAAKVAPSTASEHLAQLQDAGLVTAAPDGRKRAYSLSGPPVAEALEALGALAPPKPPRSLREATAAQLHREARTCYDHLAGSLGVAVCDALVAREWLDPADGGWTVTPRGVESFGDLGVEVDELRAGRRRSRACAWTGASAGRTSRGRSGPRSRAGCSSAAGSSAGRACAPSRSPTRVAAGWPSGSA